ncbi:MAG TPA: hypothetical protein PKA06_11055 [Gemmatales bacterium]|nr:hypothetical protein [Gemmatales bacterium]HMP16367.1 hypothetical protein [Gemmatales bacterium]
MKKRTRGILIICTGHWLYGRMTYNLALSIKAAGIQDPVCVIYTDSALSHLNDQQKRLFDHMIKVEPTDFRKIRTHLNELSPYDETLALDADMVWLDAKLDRLWPVLDQTPLTSANFGSVDKETGKDTSNGFYRFWADYADIVKSYPIKGKLYKCLATVMLFRKCKEVDKVFKLWRECLEKPKCKTDFWNGGVADEFGLNIALNLCGIEPHKDYWEPAIWDSKIPISDLRKKYYCFNFGGNVRSRRDRELYDLLMQVVCFKMGVQHVFPLETKKEHIPERHNW